MMKVVVTEAVGNKEVVFKTVGYAIKQGTPIYLSQDQYYAHDIQAGLRNGILRLEEAQKENNTELEKKVQIKNISGKPLGIDDIDLLKDEIKYISYDMAESTNMQRAQSQNLIEITYPESSEKTDDKPENTTKKKTSQKKTKSKTKKKTRKKSSRNKKSDSKKKTSNTKKEEIQKQSEDIDLDNDESEEESEQPTQDPNEPQHRMMAWDAQEEKVLDKDESSQRVGDQMNRTTNTLSSEPDDQVQVGEVDFSEDSTETEESSTEPQDKSKFTRSTKKSSTKGSSTKKKSTKKASTKSTSSSKKKDKGIKPVGKVKESANEEDIFVYGNEQNEVSFVDVEQEQERINSRGLADQNGEIE